MKSIIHIHYFGNDNLLIYRTHSNQSHKNTVFVSERERERETETNRQTGRQAGRQTETDRDRQTESHHCGNSVSRLKTKERRNNYFFVHKKKAAVN